MKYRSRQQRVLEAVLSGHSTTREIAKLAGCPKGQLTSHLSRLLIRGKVQHCGHDDWRPPYRCELEKAWRSGLYA